MALGSTQPLTKMNTGGGGGLMQPVRRADNLAAFIGRLFENPGSLNHLKPLDPF
jgi:hypothetical protein